jgi:hypothetical protein
MLRRIVAASEEEISTEEVESVGRMRSLAESAGSDGCVAAKKGREFSKNYEREVFEETP